MRMQLRHALAFWPRLEAGCVFLLCIELPLRVVLQIPVTGLIGWVERLIFAVFVVDVVLKLGARRRARLGGSTDDPGPLGDSRKHEWVFDIVSAVPFAWMAPNLPGLVLLRMLRIFRLLRRAQVEPAWMQRLHVNPATSRMMLFAVVVFGLAHWFACGWIYLGGGSPHVDHIQRYVEAAYWSVTTLTTVGYGDITPKGTTQMLYTMVAEVIGVGVYGYVIGNVASLLANFDSAKAAHAQKRRDLSTFMAYRKFPQGLQQKVHAYHDYVYRHGLGFNAGLLDGLPASLREEIGILQAEQILAKVPLFRRASPELVRDLALALRPVVQMPGDEVVREGEAGTCMYFVGHGKLEVSRRGAQARVTIGAGDFFGEMSLMADEPRNATVRACDFCLLFVLEQSAFAEGVAKFPAFASEIHERIRQRQAPHPPG